jgi:ribosomal protein L11 methylase PrmA
MVIITLLILVFVLILLFAAIVTLILVIYFALTGAPYVATDDMTLQEIIRAAQIKKGEKVVDIGSGDGKIVIALAREGAQAHGYEFNPLLVLYSRYRIRKLGLTKHAHIHWRDFWRENFSSYDVIVVYGISYIMKRLERKLRREVKPGTRVVTNYFPFPTWKPKKKYKNVALYMP